MNKFLHSSVLLSITVVGMFYAEEIINKNSGSIKRPQQS